MRANAAPMSVADYCHDYNNKKINLNDEYQRKEGVWTPSARSFFIESILLEYPIPKLYLYAKMDLKSRTSIKEIVDGQQRSQALAAFFNNKLRLSINLETEELRSQTYNQLDDVWQSKFLSYSLPIDQFSGVPENEVREAFRRMNANTVPLNDEEQRNALFQGPFKWFVVQVAEIYKDILGKIGVFSRRDLIRMSDLRLYSEIILAIDSQFQTVKGKQIDDLYKKYNGTFDKADEYLEKIRYGIDQVLGSRILDESVFTRGHIFQSIALAVIALRFPSHYDQKAEASKPELSAALREHPFQLDLLARSIQDPESFPQLYEFSSASTQKTNVENSKTVRHLYFKYAIASSGSLQDARVN